MAIWPLVVSGIAIAIIALVTIRSRASTDSGSSYRPYTASASQQSSDSYVFFVSSDCDNSCDS